MSLSKGPLDVGTFVAVCVRSTPKDWGDGQSIERNSISDYWTSKIFMIWDKKEANEVA